MIKLYFECQRMIIVVEDDIKEVYNFVIYKIFIQILKKKITVNKFLKLI